MVLLITQDHRLGRPYGRARTLLARGPRHWTDEARDLLVTSPTQDNIGAAIVDRDGLVDSIQHAYRRHVELFQPPNSLNAAVVRPGRETRATIRSGSRSSALSLILMPSTIGGCGSRAGSLAR